MDPELDLDQEVGLDRPGPRARARARRRQRRRRLGFGVGLIVIVLAAALAAWVRDDGDEEPRLGRLVASDLGGDDARWPVEVEGRPTDALAEGVHLWEDAQGWHLRIVGGEEADGAAVSLDQPPPQVVAVGGTTDLVVEDERFTVTAGPEPQEVTGADFRTGAATSITVTVIGDLPLRTGAQATVAVSPLTLERDPEGS